MAENASPKISIIVPVYKVEQYLRRCLDSIAAQTFTDWECILIDDGSPDKSGAICDEYAAKDKRFRVIHQKNAGVSAARNVGLDAAYGEWICFCDSDDWEEPAFFEKSLALCGSETDILKSGYRIITATDTVLKTILPKDRSFEEQVSCIHTSCHFIRHAYLSEHKIRFPEGITLAEDWYFNYQLSLFNPTVAYLNEVSYNYFQNTFSVMHNLKQKNIENEIAIIERAKNTIPKNDDLISLRTFDVRSEILYILQDFALYRRTFPEIRKEQFKRASIKGKILIGCLTLHFDFLAKILLKLKARSRSC